MSPRVYNHHFFTRNNSCLDLKRQCRTKGWWMWIRNDTYCSATVSFHWPDTDVLSLLVHQKCFSCTNGIYLSIWYTRSASPVPTHLLFHLVHQKCVSCTNGIFLSIWYTRSTSPVPTHLLFHLVHQKRVSCTNGAPLYIRCIQRPHHVHFLFYGTIGDPFFQVWKVMRTWNSIHLIISKLMFQVWVYSHTWKSAPPVQNVLLVFRASRCEKPYSPKTAFTW